MKTSVAVLIVAFGAILHGAEAASQLTLRNGTIFHNARIIAITGEKVTVVHAEGAAVIDADQVDLETLARAHMRLEETEAARKKRADDATARAAAQRDEEQREKETRRTEPRPAPVVRPAAPAAKPVLNREHEIARLKAAFPPKSAGNARVFIPRSGRNERPYIVSSTVTELPNGQRYASTTTRHNAGPGRIDTIPYSAPPEDTWSWYRSMLQTTTSAALPRTLQMIETRLAEDTAKFQAQVGGVSASGSAQAQHTLYWFDQALKPHLAQWRAVLR